MKTFLTLLAVALLPAIAFAAEPIDYLRDVKPILSKNCFKCHGPDKRQSELRLDTAAFMFKGGKTGPVVVAGKSSESRLIDAVTGANGAPAMPAKADPLDKKQIAILRNWIDAGAKAPADEAPEKPIAQRHWAFQPIKRPEEPTVKNTAWCRNSIDRFILARLEKEGIEPSPEADRITLIRRLSLDLLGLPPSLKEIDDFVKDARPDAYEKLVDRLLANPHFGEKWGRHWLDQARYADSNGYSIDAPRSIWKYRDWVIDALNKDMAFDQFAVEQLAGDLLPNATTEQRIATGFHRNTQINEEGGIDREQFRIDSVVDRVNTTGTVLLGLTIGCCQCHDHKFDPLTQREYYRLFAFFNNCDEPTLELATPEQQQIRKEMQSAISDLEKRLKALDHDAAERLAKWEGGLTPEAKAMLPEKIQTILAIAVNGRSTAQANALLAAFRNFDQVPHVTAAVGDPYAALVNLDALTLRRSLEQQINTNKKRLPAVTTTLVVQERATPRETHILLGGDFTRKGAVVTPGVPAPLPQLPEKEKLNRLDLANWIVDPKNPLTARVTMNRFWQVYFGLGLVETENDFGTQGTPPTHPELLDYLASEFVARKWSMKEMHRLIVTSATYRQSSRARPDLATVDPRNRLLARQNRLRLDAEVIRDSALAASGLLTPTIGGPSVYPPQPPGVYNFTQVPREWKASTGPDRYRRGIYTHIWRSAPYPALTVFDAPDGGSTCTRRNRSTTPLQALTLLNDQAYLELAQGLAARILKDETGQDENRLAYGFRLCTGRLPSEKERQVLKRLLSKQREAFTQEPEKARDLVPAELPKGTEAPEFAAWTAAARVLLNLDEFITRE
jgi:mono/diheme cytochrome c family protein